MPKRSEPVTKERPVKFPKILVNGVGINPSAFRIDMEKMGYIMGWQTEKEFKADPKNEGKKFPDPLFEYDGEKVIFWNNMGNRDFDLAHAQKLRQDVLQLKWKLNGETIIVNDLGDVISGQHRGAGLWMAHHDWLKDKRHRKLWPDEPYMLSLVAYGIAHDPETMQTLDNVKPRTDADAIYTSEIFRDLSKGEKKECSIMLAGATELLWKRTRASEGKFGKVYKTHSMSTDFRERHPHLLAAVSQIFEENRDRSLTIRVKVGVGHCAGMLYLMGQSGTGDEDVKAYHTSANPTERKLSWDRWDRAVEFWSTLVTPGDESLEGVRRALANLVSIEEGLGGRVIEKQAVIALAWLRWADGAVEVSMEDCSLEYGTDKNDNKCILNAPTFGGIDLGNDKRDAEELEEEDSVEEIEARKAEVKANPMPTSSKNGGKAKLTADQQRRVEALRAKMAGK